MGLSVYDSNGRKRHPETNERASENFASWFGTVYFRVNKRDAEIVAYARMNTGRHQEQVYLRYKGESESSLLDDFRATIKRELVEEKGWSFDWRQKVGNGDYIINTLIWSPREFETPSISDSTKREIFKGQNQQFNLALQENKKAPFVIRVGDFRYASQIADVYLSKVDSIAVAKDSNADAVQQCDLVIECDLSMVGVIDIPQETISRYKQAIESARAERRQEIGKDIEKPLKQLNAIGTSSGDVAQTIKQAAVNVGLTNIHVMGASEWNDYKDKLQQARRDRDSAQKRRDKLQRRLAQLEDDRDRLQSEVNRLQKKVKRSPTGPSRKSPIRRIVIVIIILIVAVMATGTVILKPNINANTEVKQSTLFVNGTANGTSTVHVIVKKHGADEQAASKQSAVDNKSGNFSVNFELSESNISESGIYHITVKGKPKINRFGIPLVSGVDEHLEYINTDTNSSNTGINSSVGNGERTTPTPTTQSTG